MQASHSRVTTFRRCRRRYHWEYNLNRDKGRSDGQIVGTIGHSILAMYYIERDTTVSIEQRCLDKANQMGLDMGLGYDDILRLQRSLVRYFEYADELDGIIDVKSVEKNIVKKIGRHTITGYIDLLGVLPDGRKVAMEHKFQKRPDIGNTALDPQISMYQWLGDVDVVIYNAVNVTTAVKTKTAPLLREEVSRSPQHMSLFLADLEAQLDEMEEYEAHPQRERYAYPTPSHTCSYDCGFYSACQEFQQTGNIALIESLPLKVFNREEGRDVE
jgi:hypothetical protein